MTRHAWFMVVVALQALVLQALAFGDANGQISGRVLSSTHVPLPGTVIVIWQDGHQAASTTSRSDGRFTFAASEAASRGSKQLRAKRIGFRPVSVELLRDTSGVTIIMDPLPVELAAVTTEAKSPPFAADPCTRTASPAAQHLYVRAASRYRNDTRWLDRVARYAHTTRVSDVGDREILTGLPIRSGWTRIAGLYAGSRVQNIAAVPRTLTDAQRLALPFPGPEVKFGSTAHPTAWNYPRFHEWAAPSFVSRAFVDSMPKSIVATRPAIVLAFCPHDHRAPFTAGEIELSPDTTIAVIRWRFVTSSAFAEAGGVAYFDPPAVGGDSHLLPYGATTWTRLPNSKRFDVTEYSYSKWVVAEQGEFVRSLPPVGR